MTNLELSGSVLLLILSSNVKIVQYTAGLLTDHQITFNCTSNKLYSSGRKVFKKLPNVGQIGIESTIKFETTPNGFQDGQYHDKKVCSQALEKLVCWLIVW